MTDFGPKSDSEKEIFAIESFRVDVQYDIHKLMRERGVTEEELARRLGFSQERVGRMFTDECAISVRDLAKIFFVLDSKCILTNQKSK
jgi:DNA-binding Xre family transcriptional regulator